jgi:hypothetical protein
MKLTIHIHDFSSPEAVNFLKYLHSLQFVEIVEEKNADQQLIDAIEEARGSYEKTGGMENSQVLSALKKKYPEAFE